MRYGQASGHTVTIRSPPIPTRPRIIHIQLLNQPCTDFDKKRRATKKINAMIALTSRIEHYFLPSQNTNNAAYLRARLNRRVCNKTLNDHLNSNVGMFKYACDSIRITNKTYSINFLNIYAQDNICFEYKIR